MTRAEVARIFAVLVLAYPNAEMFKAPSQQALQEKLAPTISLWATCLRDVDLWTAQQAVIQVCQTCKFPPTIAEMREAAEAVKRSVQSEIGQAYLMARNEIELSGGDLEAAYRRLPIRSRKVIDAMGGMEAFSPLNQSHFNMRGFQDTYERLLRSNPIGLPGEAGQMKLN